MSGRWPTSLPPAAAGDLEALIAASLQAVQRGDWNGGTERALEALQIDERNGHGWWLLAICRENSGDLRDAFLCYQSALSLLPDQGAIGQDLVRTALALGEAGPAVGLLEDALTRNPQSPDLADALARGLREMGRFDEACERVRAALAAHPGVATLWDTLGALMMERGDTSKALAFYTEALRLRPDLFEARFNLCSALLAAGDAERATSEADKALAAGPPPATAASLRLARASMWLAQGELDRGWAAYEARFSPDRPDATRFQVRSARWTPTDEVRGKSFLVVGEQGLGDELMFANVLPDLIEALGPDGRLTLAVEPRLVPLFARSFPDARVGAHATTKSQGQVVRTLPFLDGRDRIDLWAPLASLPRRWRTSIEAFPDRPAYLKADPARVAAWRARLDALGPEPKVGVLWASLQQYTSRLRWGPGVEAWRPALGVPGVRFVNLQYGDHAEALAKARTAGIELWDPPGVDLKRDLDEVAALSCALDLVISPPNASSNLAAACGASVWLLTGPGVWPQLGAAGFPWHPRARVFTAAALDAWAPVMAEVGEALAALAAEPRGVRSPIPGPELSTSDAVTPNAPPAAKARTLKCGVVTPVGPGHEALADQAQASVEAAFAADPGPFGELIFLRMPDPDGAHGRSRRRNQAIDEALAQDIDWLFFLDADDLMAPEAFGAVTPWVDELDAVFGLIAEAKVGEPDKVSLRANQLGACADITGVLFNDPFLTLQMGHFVRTRIAADIRFDVEMNTGEDFKYYLELWRRARCRKIEQVLFVNRRGAHSTGPRSADGRSWRAAVAQVFGDFCSRNNVSVSFQREDKTVRFAMGNPMDLIHRHFIAGRFFETEELDYLRSIVAPGSTIVEVGANVGNHLVYYGLFMQPAKIIPIEPNPAAIALLIQNALLNEIGCVDFSLLGFGIGAERGACDLIVSDSANMGAARLASSNAGGVEVFPLDEKLQSKVDFIKIDVENMEMDALKGMEALIRDSRPILFIEIMNPNVDAFQQWVEAHDYRIIRTFPYVNAKNFVAVSAEHPLARAGD